MGAFPVYGEVDIVRAGQTRSNLRRESVYIQIVPHMDCCNTIQVCDLGDHRQGVSALNNLLGGLEEQFYGSAQAALIFLEDPGHGQEDSHMAIVPAGVHYAVLLGAVGNV